MKAYKCNLPINELNELRISFWKQKFSSSQMVQWRALKNALCMDASKLVFNPLENIEVFLKTHNLIIIGDCLNLCMDNKGNYYELPNYIINDPYFEKELLNDSENINNEFIDIILMNFQDNLKTKVNICTNLTFNEVKLKYSEIEKIDLKRFRLKFYFGGSELKEDQQIFMYKIKSGYTIQVLKNEINDSSYISV
jgi:hypothetical protein